MTDAIVLVTCPDKPGIVSQVSTLLKEGGANIIHAEQALDHSGMFFQRIHCEIGAGSLEDTVISPLRNVDIPDFKFSVHDTTTRPKTALFTSSSLHCLFDLLARWDTGDLGFDPVLIVSDKPGASRVATMFGLPFLHVPVVSPREKHEERILEEIGLLGVELIVLARYMRILSKSFVDKYQQQIINIHHSFLPSFVGGNPYQDALDRGVKLIGATAHYVTEGLDEGPIIEQDVVRVSHLDSVDKMKQKGSDVEKIVLARAVKAHLEHRILVWDNRTLVFN